MKRIIVGITGASGVIYGIRLLEVMREQQNIETILIMSDTAKENIILETQYTLDKVVALADSCYDSHFLAAPVASGSYPTDAMVITPCSMKTLAAIAHGYSENLIVRAADTTLKEGRRLVLCPRETPLSAIHLSNMLSLARIGVGIIPPIPAFYNQPASIDDLVNHHIMKVMDYMGLSFQISKRWGIPDPGADKPEP